jgi:hypothetical protein
MNHPHVHMVAALAALVSTAATASQIQCQNATVDGVTVCAVNMSSYATKNDQPVCPAGVTSTGSSLICEESFAAAVGDAADYLSKNKTGPATYYIAIDPGIYDFSGETVLPGRKGAIDVSFINPGGKGCLTAGRRAGWHCGPQRQRLPGAIWRQPRHQHPRSAQRCVHHPRQRCVAPVGC